MLDVSGFKPDYRPNPTLGNIANTIIENTRYKQERDYRNQKEQQAKEQQNKLYNLREIDQDTDPTRFKTGEQRFDDYTQKELASIKNKALTEYVGLDPVEAEYKLSQDMKGLIGWHNAVKSNIENIKTGLLDFNKTYPNINTQKAHELSFLQLGNDYLEKDKDGNIVRKDPSLVKQRNYVAELNTPDNLTEIVEDVTPFAKYIQSFKPQKSGAKEYQSKRGYAVKHGYTAEITPFSEIETNEDGKPIGVRLQSEDFKYDNGVLKMLPERQFEQMMEIPAVRASIIGMWRKHKKQFEEETGQKITPANEDKMLRGFLYDEIKRNNLDQHFFKPDDAVVTPRISIHTNSGGSTSPEKIDLTEYRDVPGEGKDITDLMGGVKISSLPDGKSFLAEKVHYNPATQKVRFIEYVSKDEQGKYGTPKWKESSLTKFIQDVKTMNPGTDMKFLEGLRNPITGAKAETSSEYEIKGKKYTEAELLKMGYNKEQIAPYKK